MLYLSHINLQCFPQLLPFQMASLERKGAGVGGSQSIVYNGSKTNRMKGNHTSFLREDS